MKTTTIKNIGSAVGLIGLTGLGFKLGFSLSSFFFSFATYFGAMTYGYHRGVEKMSE